MTSPSVDLFGWTGGAFLPFDFDVGSVVHEGGHGIGLDHTFSNDPTIATRTGPTSAITTIRGTR